MNKSGGKNTISVVIISLMSRILTLLGNTMYLSFFGAANPLLNAYTYALQIPNTIFNCVGTALNTVIIPIYTSLLTKNEDEQAKEFLDNIITVALSIITVLVSLGIVLAPLIALVSGDKVDYEHKQYLIFALRVLMPVMIFYGLNYIFQGILQAHGRFKLPAFVSAPSGMVIILYMVFFAEKGGVTGLLTATFIGLALQPAIMLPAIKKIGYKYKFSFDYKNEAIHTAGKLTIPVLASVSSYQLNFLFNNGMAFAFGTVAIMSYSQTLVQTFMLTMVYAVAGVYFPRLTRDFASGDKKAYSRNLAEVFQYVMFLVLPAAVGCFMLRFRIMDFLLNWKNNGEGVVMAGHMFGLYSIGIIFICFKEILDKAFYSAKDTKTPAVYGFVIMAVNISVTLILLEKLGTYAMPLAYGISALCGFSGLFVKINKQTGFVDKIIVISIFKNITASFIMALSVKAAIDLSESLYITGSVIAKTAALGIPVIVGAAVYFGVSVFIKIPVMAMFLKKANS